MRRKERHMAREIKFRFWDKKNKKMYSNSFMIHWHDDEIRVLETDHSDYRIIPLEEGELIQYTGLKDKNGELIYEGDIVEHESAYKHVSGIFEVVYDGYKKKDFAAFCLVRTGKWKPRYKGDTKWDGVLGSQGHLAKELRVIGNKFENPNLLKQDNA